jgi:SAM-dependent methyltransferase
VAYRARFSCLWCGTDWQTRGPDDLEGWAQLCPECLDNAGSNPFLRGRLRAGLADRGVGRAVVEAAPPEARLPTQVEDGLTTPAAPRGPVIPTMHALPDDWFLRRGAFEHGAIHDTAWHAELDMVTRWLDGQPLAGRILEPAAGVGFFSPLLAGKGELHASDPDGAALDIARQRLVAHRLLAHLHVRDPWVRPPAEEPPADALVASFLLGRVRGAGLDTATQLLRDRLRDGGVLAIIDLRPDPAGGPPPGMAWSHHAPEVLEAAITRGGFGGVQLATTGRFFLVGSATAA